MTKPSKNIKATAPIAFNAKQESICRHAFNGALDQAVLVLNVKAAGKADDNTIRAFKTGHLARILVSKTNVKAYAAMDNTTRDTLYDTHLMLAQGVMAQTAAQRSKRNKLAYTAASRAWSRFKTKHDLSTTQTAGRPAGSKSGAKTTTGASSDVVETNVTENVIVHTIQTPEAALHYFIQAAKLMSATVKKSNGEKSAQNQVFNTKLQSALAVFSETVNALAPDSETVTTHQGPQQKAAVIVGINARAKANANNNTQKVALAKLNKKAKAIA